MPVGSTESRWQYPSSVLGPGIGDNDGRASIVDDKRNVPSSFPRHCYTAPFQVLGTIIQGDVRLLMDKNFFDSLYGSEEKSNSAALVIGTIFVGIAILIILAIYYVNVDIYINVARWYFMALFLSASLFSFSSYFFFKKKNSGKFKGVKYRAFIISLVILAIVFLPVAVLAFITERIKFDYFFPHSEKYIIAIFIPMIVACLIWPIAFLSLVAISWLNASTIAALFSFFIWTWGGRFILSLYKRIGKYRLKGEVYDSIKKDLYVGIFAMITFFTLVVNCINFVEPYSSMVKGVTSAFAIYIAFDRLYNKWDKANKDLENKKIYNN